MSRVLGSKNKSSSLYKHKFCPQGHDKDIVGRKARGVCAECARWSNRVYRQDAAILLKHRQKNKEWHWKQWGILNEQNLPFTVLDYDRYYQIQQGKCKCCGKHTSELNKPLKVEHDHVTKIFRGLVCQSCNIKIGVVESKDYILVKKYLGENF